MADTFGDYLATARQLYTNNVQLILQQKDSRFQDAFTYIPGVTGRQLQAVELIGTSAAISDLADHADTPHIPPKHEGIHVRPRRVSWGRLIPDSVKIMNVVDLQSPYVQEGAAAMIRARDNILYSALFGPRLIGNDSTGSGSVTSTAWAGTTIAINETGSGASGGNTGLVPGKLLKAIETLINNQMWVEGEDIYCGVAGQDNTQMFLQNLFTSSDYRSARGQFDKKVLDTVLGVKFVRYPTALTVNGASGYRELPLWVKSGMHYAEPEPFNTQLFPNPAKQNQNQVFMDNWVCATRSEDEKVIKILAV